MKQFLWSLIGFLLQLTILLVLPFVLLIKGSVFVYTYYEWNAWLALIAGVGMTFLVILIYFVFIYGTFFGLKKITGSSMKAKAWIAGLLIVGYCGYTLIGISATHAKSDEVRKEFTSLHPFLRLSVGTILFIDSGLLVTDMSRTQADYTKMGMKVKGKSLHYKQQDGYAHAMDLRTKDRSSFRNWALELYFNMMGFNTLRHGGTADHLHISLMTHDNPGAI